MPIDINDDRGSRIGWINEDGSVYDRNGNYLGRVKDGKTYNKSGSIIAYGEVPGLLMEQARKQ